MTISTRLAVLERRRAGSGTRSKRTVPAHAFDYEGFERRFQDMGETEPDFLALWLHEWDRHAAQ